MSEVEAAAPAATPEVAEAPAAEEPKAKVPVVESTGEKFKGSVKWFSIRKGFGFITPSSDNAPTEEDIFFHQTSIVSDVKNKFLETAYEVEFEVFTDENGKYKSTNVTQPDGSPCEIPERKPRKRGGKGAKKEDGEEGEEANGDAKENGENGKTGGRPRRNNKGKKADEGGETDGKAAGGGGRGRAAARKRFDDDISTDVKAKMKEKKLDMRQTSLMLVVEKSRVKFGPDGYAALCHADGIMAEGSFKTDDEGKVTLTWKNMLKFEGGEWKTGDPIASTSSGVLLGSLSWTDDNVVGMKTIETPESLWGDDKTDPVDALQSNNFLMRKCFLAKTPANPRNKRRTRTRNGGRGGGGKGGEKNDNNGKAADEKESSEKKEDVEGVEKKEDDKKEDSDKKEESVKEKDAEVAAS